MFTPMKPSQFSMNSQHTSVSMLVFLTMILLTLSLYSLHQSSVMILEWELMTINSTLINLPIIIDPMGMFFLTTVTFISFNIFIFSKSYMSHDPYITRFTYTLLLFVMSMLLLVLSPNLLTLMLGWDGLGITSFLLVIYYPTSEALNSGMVTALSNRVGDCLLLATITLMSSQGHWNLWAPWETTLNISPLMKIMMILAATTKSAQVPFSIWLPEAMAAPTPVSALVHSSTLVTAGVFLIIRLYPFLSSSPKLMTLLVMVSSTTTLAGGMYATIELDIKKIIALSTLGQVGLMMLTLSAGMPMLAYTHLITHAMFKSLLFLTVGIHIHHMHHMQNLQNLEADDYAPSLAIPASVSLASMNAFMFTAGYMSKDTIIESVIFMCKSDMWGSVVVSAYGASVSTTMTYTIRLHRVLCNSVKLVMPDGLKSYPLYTTFYLEDKNSSIRTPIMWLTVGSTVMGSMVMWAFLAPSEFPTLDMEEMMSPWLWTTYGFLLATSMCAITHKLKRTTLQKTPKNSNNRWSFFDFALYQPTQELYVRLANTQMHVLKPVTYLMNPFIMKLSNLIYKLMDQGWYSIYPPHTLKSMTLPSLTLSKTEPTKISMFSFLLLMSILIIMLTTLIL